MKSKNILVGATVGGALAMMGTALYMKKRQTIPEGAKPVKPFKLEKYLGRWYEIARLDYLFEKELDNVIAEYSMNDDGSVKVINSGYNYKTGEKEVSIGKAVFVGPHDEAMLKVSFFGPFYAGYNVIAIDRSYKYALVVGRNLNYMWLLSRETSMPDKIKTEYLEMAMNLGYDIDELIWSEHE